MSEFLATVIIIGLFCIRLGVPLLTISLVIFLLHRLENKWAGETA